MNISSNISCADCGTTLSPHVHPSRQYCWKCSGKRQRDYQKRRRQTQKELLAQMTTDGHITYQEQYRNCGRKSCSTCQKGLRHGPYWYAYWRGKDGKLHSHYVGKIKPEGEIERMKDEDLEKARKIVQAEFATIAMEETNNGAKEINVDRNQYKKTYRKVSIPEFESRVETGKILYTVKPTLPQSQWREYLKRQGMSASKAGEFMNVYRRLGSNREHIRAIATRFIPWDELARACHPKISEEIYEQFLTFFPENPTEEQMKNKTEALTVLQSLVKPQSVKDISSNGHILSDDELTEMLTLPAEVPVLPPPIISTESVERFLEHLGDLEFTYSRVENALDAMRRGHYILKQSIEELLTKIVSAN